MIFAESIEYVTYVSRFEQMQRENHKRGWFVSKPPNNATCWYLPKVNAYAATVLRGNLVEVLGVFKHQPELIGVADAVVELCNTIKANHIILDCFAPAAKAWEAAGFHVTGIEAFRINSAPALWKPEYGYPDVLYMSKENT